MDYLTLEENLEKDIIPPVYLFYGAETYLRNRFLKRLKSLVPGEVRDFNMDIVDGRETEIEAVINMATTLPFMSERRLVVVTNADLKTDLLEYLKNPLDSTCLVFCTDSVDKKHEVYKTIQKKGQVVEFSPLKGRDLNQWIEHKARELGKIIEPTAIAGLVTAVGNDLQQLSTELEKLACSSQAKKITASDVESMVSKTVESSIFELVDAVGGRNFKKAIKIAREMVFLGEPVIKILFMIARQCRLLMRAKVLQEQGCTDGQAAEQMQVHPYVAQKCIKQARNFSLAELETAMEKLLFTDANIKNGRQDPMLALELLIVALCEKN